MLSCYRCSDVTETCHRFLDLTGPFQLGGLPSLPSDFQVLNSYYTGCIRDLYINSRFIDLNSHAWHNGTAAGCQQKENLCVLSNNCMNGGWF